MSSENDEGSKTGDNRNSMKLEMPQTERRQCAKEIRIDDLKNEYRLNGNNPDRKLIDYGKKSTRKQFVQFEDLSRREQIVSTGVLLIICSL
jgi:hypothetical protein